ncbi:MAG: hypothetical protein FWD02_00960 [Bacteroidales bacterium]|nr:hypothetical protein [Bacteroidales bacterium]
MKKITSIIAAVVLLVGLVWAQQDRMFIHTGLQAYEFFTENVDSIVPVLGTTANLDELHIYKDGEVYKRFLVDGIDSIIFFPTVFEIDLSGITWEESYVYNIVVGNEIIGQLAYEFLHKHLPGASEPVVRKRAVVAYPMTENGRADLSSGLVLDNGYFITWNPRATINTLPHEILATYVAGETVTTFPTVIFLQKGASRMTTIDNPAATNRISTTLKPFVLRDERTGAAINGETTEVETYGIVKIGTQFWIRENLRTRRLADGTPIRTYPTTEPWLNAMSPGAFIGSRGISGITNSSLQNNVLNARCDLPASVVLRNRYGVVYNFHAVTHTTASNIAITVTDRLSPEGWSIPVRNQFALLVNYVYNVFGSGDNLPTVTGTQPAITGTSLGQGRLSGYTREAYPGDGQRATNITGFGAIGNNGRSSSVDGWNSNTRFLAMDTYRFVAGGSGIQNQHVMVSFQINTNTSGNTFDHSPSWRFHNTHWADHVRLIMDYDYEEESPLGLLDFGTGSIVYNFHPPMATHPVRLHYHIPRGGDPTTMPIVFSMHGNGRNAVGQINAWRAFADEHQIMVFAPEFSTQFFPGNIQYHRGWVSSSGTSWVPRPQEQWSFTLIEHMFDFILEQTGSTETQYDIVGHSAGSQFVHRMMFFLPDARIRTGIASNAGFYMMPTLTGAYGGGTFNFPYSLGGTGTTFSQADLEAYFGRNLIVHLGMADTIQDSDVSVTPGANAQSGGRPNRVERGHFFFNFAREAAEAAGVPFNWQLVEVPGVAHNSSGMIQAPTVGSAALLFTNPPQSLPPNYHKPKSNQNPTP